MKTILILILVIVILSIEVFAMLPDGSISLGKEALSLVTDTNVINTTFPTLISNDKTAATAVFTANNPNGTVMDSSNIDVVFNEVHGKVLGYTIQAWLPTNVQKVGNITYLIQNCTGGKSNSSLANCSNASTTVIYSYYNTTEYAWVNVPNIPINLTQYKITANVQFAKWIENGKGHYGYQIDWKPRITTGTEQIVQSDWAWWNVSYANRYYIDCSLMYGNQRLIINGTYGVALPGSATRNYIATNCNESLWLYYNDYTNYSVGTNLSIVPFEVISGSGTSYNAASVYNTSYAYVYHMENNISTVGNNNLTMNSTLTSTTNCEIGNCYSNDASNLGKFFISQNNAAASVIGTKPRTIMYWMKMANKPATYQTLITLYIGSTSCNQFEWRYNAEAQYNFTLGGWSTCDWQLSPNSATYGTWEFDVVTFAGSGGAVTFYQNKKQIQTTTKAFNTAAGNMYFMGRNGQPFNGSMDEVMIFNQSLSSDEINKTYNNYVGTTGYGTTGALETYSAGGGGVANCTYSGAGDYTLNLSLHCLVNNTKVVGAVKMNDAGYWYCNGNINATGMSDPGNNNFIYVNSTCLIYLKP